MNMQVKWYDWLRYSGAAATFHINPLYWWVLPHFKSYRSEFSGSDRRWEFKFLFLKVVVWIDNGAW